MENIIKLPFKGFELTYKRFIRPGNRLPHYPSIPIYPGLVDIILIYKSENKNDIKINIILLDERINVISLKEDVIVNVLLHQSLAQRRKSSEFQELEANINKIKDYIIDVYSHIKKSKASYGNIGICDKYEYGPSEYIYIDLFFDHLKVKNRKFKIDLITLKYI